MLILKKKKYSRYKAANANESSKFCFYIQFIHCWARRILLNKITRKIKSINKSQENSWIEISRFRPVILDEYIKINRDFRLSVVEQKSGRLFLAYTNRIPKKKTP